MTSCIESALVDSHFLGRISPKDERRMREHITGCADCTSHYRRRQLLAKLDPEAPSPEERLARGLGLRVEPGDEKRDQKRDAASRRRRAWPMLLGGLAVAAAAALFFRAPKDDGFHPRGSIPRASSPEIVESKVTVYRVSDKTLLPATNEFRHDDELAFAYDNAGRKPYVMIFGVDEADRVYWFYPAWTDESDNPMAVKTDPAREHATLPEAIKHRLTGRKLTVHGLFLETPQTVRDVEAALRDHRLGGMQGAIDQTTTFEVTR